jgi:ribosomal protein L40E
MMARKRTVGYVQLEWTCPNCSTRNPGGEKTCRNCGAPQPENVQFERAADEKLVTDAKAVQAAQRGADYICPYCSTRNPGDAKTCSQCGGDLVEAKRRAAGAVLERNRGPVEVTCTNCGTVNPASGVNCSKCGAPLPRAAGAVQAAARTGRATSPASAPAKKTNWLLIGGLAGALALCCAIAAFLFFVPTGSVQATVTDVHWQTSVPVQEERAVNYSNERGSPPSDAYNVSCHDESREVCEERTIDQGNGYAEVVEECHTETEQYCSYTRDEWTTIQTYTLDGNDLFPVYSDPSLGFDQRLGSVSEDFTVTFDTEKGMKSYSPGDADEFRQFRIGSTWTLKLNALGSVMSVER